MGPLSNSLAPMSYSGVDFILENSPSKSYALLESDSDVDVNHLHETVSNVFKRNGHHQHLDSSTKRCQNSVRKAKALSALSSLDVSKTKLKNTKKCLDLYFGRSKHNNCHENTETKVVRGTLNGSYDTESSEITIPTFQQTPPKLVHGNESPTNGVSSLLTLFQSPTSTTCPQKRNHVNTEECNEQPRKRTKLSDSNTKTDERRQCNNCQNSLKSVISEVQTSKVPSLLNLFQSPSSSNQPERNKAVTKDSEKKARKKENLSGSTPKSNIHRKNKNRTTSSKKTIETTRDFDVSVRSCPDKDLNLLNPPTKKGKVRNDISKDDKDCLKYLRDIVKEDKHRPCKREFQTGLRTKRSGIILDLLQLPRQSDSPNNYISKQMVHSRKSGFRLIAPTKPVPASFFSSFPQCGDDVYDQLFHVLNS